MKITVFSEGAYEACYFEKFGPAYGVELNILKEAPLPHTIRQAEGSQCISILTTPIDDTLMRALHEMGVQYISTRTIGYDHIDLEAAREFGIHVGNVNYSVHSVADYTIMMILMATRRIQLIMQRSERQDYTLTGVQGRELHNLTVGVLGTGRIGSMVIRQLSGFGCKILAYDLCPRKEVEAYAQYVSLEQLYQESDVITLHMPASEENYHMINRSSLAQMRRGVLLINTARGSLIDSEALIDALEEGQVGGAALDVVEHELGLYYNDLKGQPINNRELALLRAFPNVIVTPHTAFFTDQAVSDMVEFSIKSCVLTCEGRKNPWMIL